MNSLRFMANSHNQSSKNAFGLPVGGKSNSSTLSQSLSSPDSSFSNVMFPSDSLDPSSDRFLSASSLMPVSTDSMLSSFWIGNILDAMSLQDDIPNKSTVSCSCDDGFKVDFYNKESSETLCQKCGSAQCGADLTKAHNITTTCSYPIVSDENEQQKNRTFLLPPSSKSSNNSCAIHPTELLQFFCHSCSSAICTQCTRYDHNGHNFQYLQQVVESSKASASSTLVSAKNSLRVLEGTIVDIQRMINRVGSRSTMAQSEIHDVIDKHMMALKQRERELIGKVDQIRRLKCRVLGSQMNALQGFANTLKIAIDETDAVIKTDDSLRIIKAKERLFAEATSCPSGVRIAEDDDLLFSPPDTSTYLAIGLLGDIKTSVCAHQSVLVREGGTSNTAVCRTSVLFTILARDHVGEAKRTRSDVFEVTVRKPDNNVFRVDVVDSGAGRYTFQVHVGVEGDFVISVMCRGVPVCDSPYFLKVKHSVNYSIRAASGAPSLAFGKEGDKPGDLCRPWGICCDPQGYLIVADRSNNRLQIFNPDGTFHHMFGCSGSRPGQFDRPAGVAVDKKGHIVVADKDNHRIQIFRFDGTFVCVFGERGSKNGQFNYPWDVAINSTGVIAVTDTRNHRIQLFSFDGAFLSKYGFEGAMWKHFDSPRGIAFTQDSRLIVTDFNNHRLVIIQPDMQSARYLGSEGSQTLQFLRPQGVAVDEAGNIVVADSRNHRLQVFTPSGGLLAVFGGSVQANITPPMDRPSGVTVTPDGHIAVVDFGNNRVLVF